MTRQASLRGPRSRLLRLVVGGVAALYGSYLVFVNILLWSGGLGWLLHELASDVRLETGRSYSLWFFRVELRGLHLSVMDSNVHVEIEVPEGSVQVMPHRLLSSRFHTSHVTGSGFVFRLRPNYDSLPDARREALPDLIDASEPLIEGTTAPEDLWGLVFEGLDIDFDEIWISEFRMMTGTHVRGGFVLRPELEVEIFPSEVTFSSAELRFGAHRAVARPFDGTLSVRLPRTRFDEPLPWAETSFRSELSAEWTDPTFVNAYLTSPGGPRIEGGHIATELNITLERDDLRLRARSRSRGVRLELGALQTRVDAIVAGNFRAEASKLPAGRLDSGFVDASRLEFRHPDFHVDEWSLRLDLPELTVKRSPLEVSGPIMAAAEDIRPVAELIDIPALLEPLERFLRLPNLGLIGSLYLTEQRQQLHVDRATSDTVDVRGRLVRIDDALYSAVLLDAAPFHVGVYTGPDEGGFHLAADAEWLERELEKLP